MRPRKTIEPSKPYYMLSRPISFFIVIDPAGKVPWSIFPNKFVKRSKLKIMLVNEP